jgi:peroxiredoxin
MGASRAKQLAGNCKMTSISHAQRTTALLLTLLLKGCGSSQPHAAEPASSQPSSTHQTDEASTGSLESRPPDFELDSLDGRSVRLSDHLGKQVVLIDFWATYCHPCLQAMPHLEELYLRYKERGLVILGVSIDGPESVAQVRSEVAKLGVTFPILLDQETQVVSLYNPKTSAPFSVLIGRDGRVLAKKEGYTTTGGSQLEGDIAQALQ